MEATTAPSNTHARLLRKKEVLRRVPLAAESIRQLEIKGMFPKRFTLPGTSTVVWDAALVEAWLDAQIENARLPRAN